MPKLPLHTLQFKARVRSNETACVSHYLYTKSLKQLFPILVSSLSGFSLSVVSSVYSLAGAEAWQLRYSAVQALVCVCRGLSGAVLQEGLRNVAWITLQEHLCQETDQRVGDAARVIEVLS